MIGLAVLTSREAVGLTQLELSERSGVSTGMIAMVEAGAANVTVDLAGRLLTTLQVTVDIRWQMPHVERHQRDAGHSRCGGYSQRRLESAGWLVRREVEVIHGRSHGWIDILALHPQTRVLLVIEIKTEIHDVGQIERTLGWYGREAWAAARRFGWEPSRVRTALVVLATEANEDRLRANREALAQSFPDRAMAVLEGDGAGLALIDPRSRRRDWLIRARIDGRCTPAPYRDYADFVRQGGG